MGLPRGGGWSRGPREGKGRRSKLSAIFKSLRAMALAKLSHALQMFVAPFQTSVRQQYCHEVISAELPSHLHRSPSKNKLTASLRLLNGCQRRVALSAGRSAIFPSSVIIEIFPEKFTFNAVCIESASAWRVKVIGARKGQQPQQNCDGGRFSGQELDRLCVIAHICWITQRAAPQRQLAGPL